jgi:Mn-dependent DtxR family transcriptional regulator
MNAKSTPDERFLIKLYQTANEKGDLYLEVDMYAIAQSLGQKETATKNIVKHLAQANFVKKVSDTTIHLTERGVEFVLNSL